jgi:hypothetical protein
MRRRRRCTVSNKYKTLHALGARILTSWFVFLSEKTVLWIRDIWYGSESADPYHRLADPNPDLALFVSDFQDAQEKIL